MDLVWFLVLGAVVGWLAGRITKGSGFGLIGNVVVGVLGAFLGGFLARELGIAGEGLLGHMLVALGGALVLLFLLGFVSSGKKKR